MSSGGIALVRDVGHPNHTNLVIADSKKFEKTAQKATNQWNKMSGASKCFIGGSGIALAGSVMLIGSAINGTNDKSGLAFLIIGLIIAIFPVCSKCKPKEASEPLLPK